MPRWTGFARARRFGPGCWRLSRTRRATGCAPRAAAPASRCAWPRRGAPPPRGPPAPGPARPPPPPRPDDAVPSPEAALLDSERREHLLAAIERLPDPAREAIACRYLLELSEDETAAALDCPRGTVKSRVSRALDRLRVEVGEEGQA